MLLYLILVFSLGCSLLAPFLKKLNLEFLVLSWAIGFGGISFILFISSLASNSFTVGYIAIIILSSFGIVYFLKRIKEEKVLSLSFKLEILYIILVIFIGLLFFSPSLKFPFLVMDAWSTWGLKGKIFFIEQKIPFELFGNKKYLFYITPGNGYPLSLPLNESFLCTLMGEFSEPKIKLIFLFFVGLSLIVINIYANFLNKIERFALSCIFLFTPLVIHHSIGYFSGCADIIFMFYNFLTFIMLWKYFIIKRKIYFYLSAIFAGICLWTKLEGLITTMVFILTLLYLFPKKKVVSLTLKFLGLILVINAPWALVRFSYSIKEALFLDFKFPILRIKGFLHLLFTEVNMVSKWDFFWWLFIPFFFTVFLKKGKQARYFILVFILQVFFYFFITTFSSALFSSSLKFYPASPLDRLLLQTFLIAIFIMALSLNKKEQNWFSKEKS